MPVLSPSQFPASEERRRLLERYVDQLRDERDLAQSLLRQGEICSLLEELARELAALSA